MSRNADGPRPSDSDPTGSLSRRHFIQLASVSGGGLILGLSLKGCSDHSNTSRLRDSPTTFRPHAFLRLDGNDRVTVMISKAEMGQGVTTALAMIIAGELGVRWDQVDMERVELDEERYGAQATGGSSTIRLMWMPLRQAGATIRALLTSAGAARWGVDPSRCDVREGRVVHLDSDRILTFGELASDAAALPLPDTVELRTIEDLNLVGHRQSALELGDIVTGRVQFGLDTRMPDMRFAAVIRPPRPGAKIRAYNASSALQIPGVLAVVEVPEVGEPYHVRPGVAVVARDTWTALEARDHVRVDWDESEVAKDNTDTIRRELLRLVERPGDINEDRGNANEVLETTSRKISATYEQAFLYHAQMEPMNCTASVSADRCVFWSPCQFPDWVARGAAEILDLEPEKIEVHVTRMGGGFGRRINPDFSLEAALVAREYGTPIQLVWSREDDLHHGFFRPMVVHRLEAALDGHGDPLAIRHRGAAAPGAGSAGLSYIPYRCPALRSESASVETSMRRGWWRSVTHSHTAFAIESFMDEMAEAAGRDPIEYRIELIDGSSPMPLRELEAQGEEYEFDPARLRRVLEVVRERSGWTDAQPPADRWRGVACHWCMATYVAEVVEISLVSGSAYTVERVTAAVDCGIVVDPDGARAQVEGGIVDALSAARHQRVTVTDGVIDQANFDDYRITRMSQAPRRIDVHFVPSNRPPSGLGEPPVPPAAAALANALYAATGRRFRRQPFDVFGSDA